MVAEEALIKMESIIAINNYHITENMFPWIRHYIILIASMFFSLLPLRVLPAQPPTSCPEPAGQVLRLIVDAERNHSAPRRLRAACASLRPFAAVLRLFFFRLYSCGILHQDSCISQMVFSSLFSIAFANLLMSGCFPAGRSP